MSVPVSLRGTYAGVARFTPRYPDRIPLFLRSVVGQLVDVGHAGIAPAGDAFAGQPLYLEWRRDDLFDGFLIPEQDLVFVKRSLGATTGKAERVKHDD